MRAETPADAVPLSPRPRVDEALAAEIRRSRRHPRRTQFDYLHVRHLLDGLVAALAALPAETRDVLDVFCGTRPYEDLLPAGSRCVGLDVDDYWGAADVVSRDFLPFDDESFDLVLCSEGFHFVADPVEGAAEMQRVLRPGGSAIVTVPFVWEYDRTFLEHRFTGPELAALFGGWDDVTVVENGGRGVAWATLTASILRTAEKRLAPRRPVRTAFAGAYGLVNGLGALVEWSERRYATGPMALPMNLLVSARRPASSHAGPSPGRRSSGSKRKPRS